MILESIFGIITGLGGSVATGIMNHRTQKLKNEHDIALIQAETNAMIAETEANIKITEQQVARDLELSANDNFRMSQEFGNRVNVSSQLIEKLFERRWTTVFGVLLTFLLGLVDVVRTGMRPAITIVLMVITAYITQQSVAIVMQNNNMLTSDQVFNLISSIIYLTFTVVGWWFGDRSIAKFYAKK